MSIDERKARQEHFNIVTELQKITTELQRISEREDFSRKLPDFVQVQVTQTLDILANMRDTGNWDQPHVAERVKIFADKVRLAINDFVVNFDQEPYGESPIETLAESHQETYPDLLSEIKGNIETYMSTVTYENFDNSSKALFKDYLNLIDSLLEEKRWGDTTAIARVTEFGKKIYKQTVDEVSFKQQPKNEKQSPSLFSRLKKIFT